MARTKTFDEGVALDRAMNLFWEQGYEATSVRELSMQTGIGISSLYNAFGDKHNVYGAALERYGAIERDQFASDLATGQPIKALLSGMFADLIDTLLADDGSRGSFTLNAAIELGGRDPAVTRRLRDHFEAISELLAARLAAAQEAGEVQSRLSPDELAQYLLLGLYSLAVMVKIMPDRARLETVAAITLSVLDRA
jgi:TetR/AcrR family transcriptional repressor of nem operon